MIPGAGVARTVVSPASGRVLVALVASAVLTVGLASLSTKARAQSKFGTVHSVAIPDGEKGRLALLGDLNGDGRSDLVIASSRRGGAGGRFIRVRSGMAAGESEGQGAFTTDPTFELKLTPDAVAVAIGDVHPDPGQELVLFFATAVVAVRTSASEKDRYAKLGDVDYLFQLAHPRRVLDASPHLLDADGDGHVDLVVPEPNGYRVLLQNRTEEAWTFDRESRLRVPPTRDPFQGAFRAGASDGVGNGGAEGGDSGSSIQLDLGDGDTSGDAFLRVSESVSYLAFVDWDADGDLDGITQSDGRFLVFPQEPRGVFASDPTLAFPLPIEDVRSQTLDVSYRAHALDLDADGQSDYVMLAGDSQSRRKSKDPRTQVLVFTRKPARGEAKPAEAPLFGEKGVPDQLLVLSGFAGGSQFARVDADGLPDFVVGSLRLDLLDQIRDALRDSVDIDLYVYRNEAGRFAKTPSFSHSFRMALDDVETMGDGMAVNFLGDLSGDGTSELLLRSRPTQIQIFMVRAQKDRWSLVDRPLFEMTVEEDARVEVVRPEGGTSRVLVLEDQAVHHVRFP